MAPIRIERLARPIHEGDWHDTPLKWEVIGPGDELQRFSTRDDARRYRRIRRRSASFNEACNAYVKESF